MITSDNAQAPQKPSRQDAALKRGGGQSRKDKGTRVSSDSRTRWLALIASTWVA